jgi:hypothetical protein
VNRAQRRAADKAVTADQAYRAQIKRQAERITTFIDFLQHKGLLVEFNEWESTKAGSN